MTDTHSADAPQLPTLEDWQHWTWVPRNKRVTREVSGTISN